MKTRVIIVDDHKIVREGLRRLLDDDGGFEVVGEAGNGRDGVQLAKRVKPDVVIMDVAMSEMNGIEATRKLLAALPEVRVLALSMHSDSRFVKQMLEAGALGRIDEAHRTLVVEDPRGRALVQQDELRQRVAVQAHPARHRKLGGRIDDGAVLRAGQSIADFVDRLASGIVRGVAGVIFKPLPPAVRNVLFTAATIYGEHFLTQKFWSSGLGQSISNWSDKLTRIDTRLAGLYDEIKEIEGKLENFEGELSAAAREKLEERLGVLRDRVSRQRPDQIRVMETLQRITRGIRPTRPQVPSGVVTPPRTTEGTGRGRGPCCGG